ncbi:aldose epimerase family protein [Ancylomarina sp. 16SWW S1-10-2]|uniref:aldose epimerase family protein n=1 Tax=Ancylomarina sp. 16SWW S1-10-2 TaxID=2499681 RepID=UPI0012AE39B0|nr:aldose epimerase family protein [Ancylomarina sp. 16SWW S1-10-2]MRT92025.1 galactose mutarotase [Ancylomarina sp. 16SWW S1-10-2]
MKTQKSHFGDYQESKIDLFALENDNGMLVKIMNYGATITSITVPGSNGSERTELVCGFESFDSYFAKEYVINSPYFGSTVGRYCSQIKKAKFSLEGKEYQLATNAGENNLHGGNVGFDKKVWQAKSINSDNAVGVEMSLESPDMEEGFPGNVVASVTFQLTNKNEIIISYKATTDKITPLSLTNHTYFNLSGFKNDITNHKVSVLTGKRLETDETGAATGLVLNLDHAEDDLRGGKIVSEVQKAMGKGFEHFFIFEDAKFELQKVAEIIEPKSGRKLEVETTEPCMLFYTGTYTSDELKRETGDQFGKYRGFCCETHRYQNGPNIQGSPKTFTKPNETFESQTIYRLTF